MRMLVTGNSGQVVTALREAAKADPAIEPLTLGRPDLDLDRPETVATAIASARPDVVVSAAAWTAVDAAEDEPEATFRANAESAGEVARGAALVGAPVIHLSTDYVFDGSRKGAWAENDPVAPLGVYGASKLEGEMRVAAANNNHVILRTAWVFSPWGKNFVKTMLALAATRERLTVVDDQYGCPTSAIDIADAVLAIARHLERGNAQDIAGIYHLAGTGSATWCDFAREIFRQAEKAGLPAAAVTPVATEAFPTKATRPANSRLDCSKFEQTFGWRPRPWWEALHEVIAHLAEGKKS